MPLPDDVVMLRKEVLRRLGAAQPFPRDTVDDTLAVLEAVVFDAGIQYYLVETRAGRRLWIQPETHLLVQDRRQTVAAQAAHWETYLPALWISYASSVATPAAPDDYMPGVGTHFFFQEWRIGTQLKRLNPRVEKALDKGRVDSLDRLAQRVEEADIRGDSSLVYKTLDMIAPKARPVTYGLRKADGTFALDQDSEFQEISDHICRVFDAEIVEGGLEKPEVYTSDVEMAPEVGDGLPLSHRIMNGPRVAIYTDGSATGRGHGAIAGWAFVAVLEYGQLACILAIWFGPVVIDRRRSGYVGAEGKTNNTGEMSAQVHAHAYGRLQLPPEWPAIARYDSTYAQSVASGKYLATGSRELARRLRGERSAHHQMREMLDEKHIRGDSDSHYNDLVDKYAKLGPEEEELRVVCLSPMPWRHLLVAFRDHAEAPHAGAEAGLEEATSAGVVDEQAASGADGSDLADRTSIVSEEDQFFDLESDHDGDDGEGVANAEGEVYEFHDCIGPPGVPEGAPDSEGQWRRRDRGFARRMIFGPKDSKASPPGSPMAEVWKFVHNVIRAPLMTLLSMISDKAQLPSEWSHAVIFWVRKPGGDGSSLNGFRSICRLVHSGKGYVLTHTKTLQRHFQRVAPANMYAYLKGRSGLQAIHCLHGDRCHL